MLLLLLTLYSFTLTFCFLFEGWIREISHRNCIILCVVQTFTNKFDISRMWKKSDLGHFLQCERSLSSLTQSLQFSSHCVCYISRLIFFLIFCYKMFMWYPMANFFLSTSLLGRWWSTTTLLSSNEALDKVQPVTPLAWLWKSGKGGKKVGLNLLLLHRSLVLFVWGVLLQGVNEHESYERPVLSLCSLTDYLHHNRQKYRHNEHRMDWTLLHPYSCI